MQLDYILLFWIILYVEAALTLVLGMCGGLWLL